MTDQASSYRWIQGQGTAFGAPGAEPRWTSSRKDAVGMAYSAASRIWYTISHGVLNEIYYPTIDRPQTRDMEFLLTDGETFVHEEKRDLERTFEYIDANAAAVRLTNADPQGRYKIIKDIIADPHHGVVLMRVRLEGEEGLLSRMKAYAMLAPHLDVGGANNSGLVLDLAGKQVLLATKNGLSLVMASDCGFTRASCGYVGHSDGWQDLMDNFRMDWQFGSAPDGNIALTGEIDIGVTREFVVAIALGEGHHAALTAALGAVTTPFEDSLQRFILQWHRAATPDGLAGAAQDAGRLLQISQNIILSHEDKYYSGAFIASASIPWGQHKGDDDVGGYHLVWTRDMVQSAYRAAGVRPRGYRPASPGVPRLHPETRWQLCAKLLDQWNSLLGRHSTRRGGLSHHPGLAIVESRWPGRVRRLPLRRARRRVSGAPFPGDPAGALGGGSRVFALHPRRGDLRFHLCRRYRACQWSGRAGAIPGRAGGLD